MAESGYRMAKEIRTRWQFLGTLAWGERNLALRLVYVGAVGGPALVGVLNGVIDRGTEWWLPWWTWLLIAAIVFAGFLAFRLFERAFALELARQPKIVVDDIAIWTDSSDRQFVRVRVRNCSSEPLTALIAQLRSVSDSVGALAIGHFLTGPQGAFKNLNLPLQLLTQERLKERLAGGEKFARPFNLAPNDHKWIEVIHIDRNWARRVAVYDADGEYHLILPMTCN